MSKSIPDWAVAALTAFEPCPGLNESEPNKEAVDRHILLCKRVEQGWPQIAKPFSRCVKSLSETGKQIVLEQALWVAKYHQLNFGEIARSQMGEMLVLHDKISIAADVLAGLLRERDELASKGHVKDNMPDMEELIEQAAKFYPDWAMVAEDDMSRFLINSRTQSRPGPTPLDFVMCMARPYEAYYSNAAANITLLRNAAYADIVRLMIEATSCIVHPEVPDKFSLSDPAIEALCNALYGVNDFSADNIKTMRARDRRHK